MGAGAIDPVIAERGRGGPFKSVEDLSRRADLHGMNRRVLESLIKAGALDEFGDRGTLLNNVPDILSLAQREQRLRESGQSTMFDLWGQTVSTPLPPLQLKPAEINPRERSQWEKELLGVALSRQFAGALREPGMIWPSEIDAEMDGQSVAVVGEVAQVTELFTRERKPFVKAVLEDISGSIETMVWPRVYDADRDLWQEGNTLVIEGKVRVRDDAVQLNCDRARRYQPAPASPESVVAEPVQVSTPPVETPDRLREPVATAVADRPPASAGSPARKHRLVISLGETADRDEDISRLHKVVATLREFSGEDEVSLCLNADDKVTHARLTGVSTGYCPELRQRLEALVGEDGLTVDEP